MSATYDGLEFETALLAQWAAFFDLAGWKWEKDPIAVGNWEPDFRVTFNCSHSECDGSHTILVSILPVKSLGEIQGHPAFAYGFSVEGAGGVRLADAGAVFGDNPSVTQWEMAHGAGGGTESVDAWVDQAESLWRQASVRVS